MMGVVVTFRLDEEDNAKRQKFMKRLLGAIEFITADEYEVHDLEVTALPGLTKTHPSGPTPRRPTDPGPIGTSPR